MDRKSRHEISPVFIRFKDGWWGAVLLNGPQDFGYPRSPAFGQIQLLEKLADPAVPVAAGYPPAGAEVINVDGSVRAGVAGDRDAIRKNADLDGLPDLIAAVVNRVDEGLFQGFIGVVEEALRLGYPPLLNDDLFNENRVDISKGLLDHAVKRALENLFAEDIAARSVGELDDVNLGLGKKRSGTSLKKSRPTLRGRSISSGPATMSIWRQSWVKSIPLASP